jgi:hypothetical protein
MITLTQLEHDPNRPFFTHANYAISDTALDGLFRIRSFESRSNLRDITFGFSRGAENVTTNHRNYSIIYSDGKQCADGLPGPSGVIVATRDFSCAIYDVIFARQFGLQGTGFVVIVEDGLTTLEYPAYRIFPTQYYSNPFSRLYSMLPSGVVSLEDRVICTYVGSPTLSSIAADHVIYEDINPIAAYGVKESKSPTVLLRHDDHSIEYTQTIAEIIRRRALLSTLPSNEGFVISDFPRDRTAALQSYIRQLRDPSTLSQVFTSRILPNSITNTGVGTVLTCVPRYALEDPVVKVSVISGIISESTLVGLFQTGNINRLKFGVDSSYTYFEVQDDFGTVVQAFTTKYLDTRRDLIKLTFTQMQYLASVAKIALEKAFSDQYGRGLRTGILEACREYNNFVGFETMPERLRQAPTCTLDQSSLESLSFCKPPSLTLIADFDDLDSLEANIAAHIHRYATRRVHDAFMKDVVNGSADDATRFRSVLKSELSKAREEETFLPVFTHEYYTEAMNEVVYEAGYNVGYERVKRFCQQNLNSETIPRAAFNVETHTSNRSGWISISSSSRGQHCGRGNRTRRNQQATYYPSPSRRSNHGAIAERASCCIIQGVSVSFLADPIRISYVFDVAAGIITGSVAHQAPTIPNDANNILRQKMPRGVICNSAGIYRGLHAPNVGVSGKRAYCTRHNIRLEPELLETVVLEDPTPSWMERSFIENFYKEVFRAVGSLAAKIAYDYVEPMIELIQVNATQTLVGHMSGAVVSVADIVRLISFDDAYVERLKQLTTTAIRILEENSRHEEAMRLRQFVNSLGMLVSKAFTATQFHLINRASMNSSQRISDENTAGYAFLYGSDGVI